MERDDHAVVRHRDERLVIATRDNLLVCGWTDAPTGATMRRMETVAREIERSHPAMLLNVAFSGRPNFDEEVRRLSMDYTGDASLFGLGRAHVVLMSGLGGTAVRAFMATFILMGRPPCPTKVFSGVDDAARWLVELATDTPLPWTIDVVRSVVDVVRPSST